MEPEIARRCPDCGASVRGDAFFCPQCGKMLKAGATDADSAAETHAMPARRVTDAARKKSDVKSESLLIPAAETSPAQVDPADTLAVESLVSAEVVVPPASSGDDGRSTRQRMTAAARDVVEEKLSPRVEKLRHASNVMLEEASYDPSLRFILVAIAILVLSLLLLLLNYLLG